MDAGDNEATLNVLLEPICEDGSVPPCEDDDDDGIPIWVIILICFAVAIVIAGVAVAVFVFLKMRNRKIIDPRVVAVTEPEKPPMILQEKGEAAAPGNLNAT